MTAAQTPVGDPRSRRITQGAIDCDVHPNLPNGLPDLVPFMDDVWVKRIGLDRRQDWGKNIPAMEVSLPLTHWVNPSGTQRLDAIAPSGGPPCSDPQFVVEDLIERHGFDAVVLNGNAGLVIGGFADPDLAAAIAAAHNDWLASVWLDADERFKGSIVVGTRDPQQAVEEIARWAGHPQMVQVFVPFIDRVPMGQRHFYPIYEAAEHHGLPIVTHVGGEGSGINSSMMAVGEPTYYFEFHSSLSQIPQAQLISLISHGVFERFPKLKVIFSEGGFAWLIEVLWRLDQKWKAIRHDVPWLTRLPSEYYVDHVRVTSQPMYEPERSEHLAQVLEMIHARETLLFSTDYPHWDSDDPRGLKAVPADVVERMMRANPREIYGL